MKTKILIILIVFSVSNIFAQTDSLTFSKNIETLRSKIISLENQINELQKTSNNQVAKPEFESLKNQIETIKSANTKFIEENNSIKNSQSVLKNDYKKLNSDFEIYKRQTVTEIDSLQQIVNSNSANIKTTANELGVKIDDTHKFTNQSISDLNKTVSQNTLYWIIAILVVALLVLVVFVLLRKQIFKQRTDLNSSLLETRKILEEEGVKLDNKLIEVLETQLKIINSSSSNSEKEADHTLALKVADEIIRIQKNLLQMDEKTKGLKQLTASVKRIQDNFASNGYELVEMLGKPFNDGMKVSANFIPDEDLEAGQQVITRIIKPQVNYKGVMIQSAQIEVSQG